MRTLAGLATAVVLAVSIGPTGATSAWSAPRAQVSSPHGPATDVSTVSMTSDDGDYIGQGVSRSWEAPADTISVSGSDSDVVVQVSGTGGDFYLTFGGASGAALTDGTYDNAESTPPAGSDVPSLDVFGDGRGCDGSGSFTVHDLSAHLARVWITYEFHCFGDPPATYGEIRIGEPAPAGPRALPTQVAWPAAYPGVTATPVGVRLENTGTTPLHVDQPEILAGSADFRVTENDCLAAVAPGDSCTVYVGFLPSRPGTRLGELSVLTSAGERWVPLSGTGRAGLTSWDLDSAPGDPIGQGQSYAEQPINGATIVAHGDESHLDSTVTWDGHRFDASFDAGPDRLLLTGARFSDVTATSGDLQPSMSIEGDGRACNTVSGSFTVQNAAYDAQERLTRLQLSFTQYCEQGSAALTGTITYRMPDGSAPTPDTTAPPRVTMLYVSGSTNGSTSVDWQNPVAADWVDTVIRYAAGRQAPATAQSGRPLYVGRGSSATALVQPRRAGYSFSAFTRDTSGNMSRAATFYLPPFERITLHAPARVKAGTWITLHGTLTVAGTKPRVPFAHHPMRIRAGRPGQAHFHVIARFRTRADGSYRVRVRLWHTKRFIVDDSFTNQVRESKDIEVRVTG